MSLLYDAYVAWLANITHKTGNEIHWEDSNGKPITVEPLEDEKYIIRRYCRGKKYRKIEYQNELKHGKDCGWNGKGQKYWEVEFRNGLKHGKDIGWYSNGQMWYKREYQNGKIQNYTIWWKDGSKQY